MSTRPSQPIVGRIKFWNDFCGHVRFKQGESVKLHGANGAVMAGLDISESRTNLRWQLYPVKFDNKVSQHRLSTSSQSEWSEKGGILEKPFDPEHRMIKMDAALIMTKIKDKKNVERELLERCEVLGLPSPQTFPEDFEAHICGLALRLYDPESNRVVFEAGYSNKIRDTITYGPPKPCEIIEPACGEPEGGVMRINVRKVGSHPMSPEGKLFASYFDGDQQIGKEEVLEKRGPKGENTISVRYPSVTLLSGETTKIISLKLETEYGDMSGPIEFTYNAPASILAADEFLDYLTYDEGRKGDELPTSSITHFPLAEVHVPTEDPDEFFEELVRVEVAADCEYSEEEQAVTSIREPQGFNEESVDVQGEEDCAEEPIAPPNPHLELDINSMGYSKDMLLGLISASRAKKEEARKQKDGFRKQMENAGIQMEEASMQMERYDKYEQHYLALLTRAEEVVVNGIEKEELGLIDAEEEHMDVDENHAIEEEGLDGQSQAEGDRMSTDTSEAKAQESVEASEVDISHATTSPTFYTTPAQPEQTPASPCTSLTSAQSISPATSATSDPALFYDVNGSALAGTSSSGGGPTALFPVLVVQQPSFGATTVLSFKISSIPPQMPDEQRREYPFVQRENFLDHTGQLSSLDNGGGLGSPRMCKMVVAPNPASKQPQRTFDGNKVYNPLSNEKVDSFFNMKQPGSVKAGDSARTADPPLAFTYDKRIAGRAPRKRIASYTGCGYDHSPPAEVFLKKPYERQRAFIGSKNQA